MKFFKPFFIFILELFNALDNNVNWSTYSSFQYVCGILYDVLF